MARAIALAALVTLVSTTGMARASDVEDMGAAVDLTGVDGSSEADGSAGAVPDLTVEDRGAQQPERPYGVWDRLAQCESGGNWHIIAYHHGGLQFLPATWTAYGGGQYARYAYQATREQQIAIAEKVQRAAGVGAVACLFTTVGAAMTTTNGKHPQAVQWPIPERHPITRISDGRDMTRGDRMAVLGAWVICSFAAGGTVVVIGGLLYLGAHLMKGLLHG